MKSHISDVPPPGFIYLPDFISRDEEILLLNEISHLTFTEVKMHGIVARRKVVHFGMTYRYGSRTATADSPLPLFLQPFIKRAADSMHVSPRDIKQILLTYYPPGAGIGWHRDAPVFGNQVFGISLKHASPFRLRLKTKSIYTIFKTTLAERSAYLLSKEARTMWEHHLPPVKAERYSLTFRTLASATLNE